MIDTSDSSSEDEVERITIVNMEGRSRANRSRDQPLRSLSQHWANDDGLEEATDAVSDKALDSDGGPRLSVTLNA